MTIRRNVRAMICPSIVLSFLLSTLLGACATSDDAETRGTAGEVPVEVRSGFLQDYERLEKVPGEEAVLRWVNTDAEWSKYDRFLVDPVQFRVPPAYKEQGKPKPEAVSAMTHYFRQAIIRELGSKFEIVEEPGAGVIRIRVALTSLAPTSQQLEAWQYVPVALVATGIAEATGLRGEDALIFMEGEVSDSLNGELMGEVLQGRISEDSDAETVLEMTAEDIEPVLDFWAAELLRRTEKARVESP